MSHEASAKKKQRLDPLVEPSEGDKGMSHEASPKKQRLDPLVEPSEGEKEQMLSDPAFAPFVWLRGDSCMKELYFVFKTQASSNDEIDEATSLEQLESIAEAQLIPGLLLVNLSYRISSKVIRRFIQQLHYRRILNPELCADDEDWITRFERFFSDNGAAIRPSWSTQKPVPHQLTLKLFEKLVGLEKHAEEMQADLFDTCRDRGTYGLIHSTSGGGKSALLQVVAERFNEDPTSGTWVIAVTFNITSPDRQTIGHLKPSPEQGLVFRIAEALLLQKSNQEQFIQLRESFMKRSDLTGCSLVNFLKSMIKRLGPISAKEDFELFILVDEARLANCPDANSAEKLISATHPARLDHDLSQVRFIFSSLEPSFGANGKILEQSRFGSKIRWFSVKSAQDWA